MNKIFNVNNIIKAIMIAIFVLLLLWYCQLFYEYHFCPGIMHIYEIPDILLVTGAIACIWGIASTLITKRLSMTYWIKVVIIFIVYIYTMCYD